MSHKDSISEHDVKPKKKKKNSDEQPQKEYTYAESHRIYAAMNEFDYLEEDKSAKGDHQPGD
ncbi:MAG: hypothetical protein Q4C15_13285 [Eubacteriales bacterium]|nr:hypothetical protein [Eubacteriales bacterium]